MVKGRPGRSSALVFLWRHHRAALIGLVLALLLSAMFTARFVMFSLYWADPAHGDQAIEGWMTPHYVARSYGTEPEVIERALGLDRAPAHRRTLDRIAADRGVPLAVLAAEIEAAVDAGRRDQ